MPGTVRADPCTAPDLNAVVRISAANGSSQSFGAVVGSTETSVDILVPAHMFARIQNFRIDSSGPLRGNWQLGRDARVVEHRGTDLMIVQLNHPPFGGPIHQPRSFVLSTIPLSPAHVATFRGRSGATAWFPIVGVNPWNEAPPGRGWTYLQPSLERVNGIRSGLPVVDADCRLAGLVVAQRAESRRSNEVEYAISRLQPDPMPSEQLVAGWDATSYTAPFSDPEYGELLRVGGSMCEAGENLIETLNLLSNVSRDFEPSPGQAPFSNDYVDFVAQLVRDMHADALALEQADDCGPKNQAFAAAARDIGTALLVRRRLRALQEIAVLMVTAAAADVSAQTTPSPTPAVTAQSPAAQVCGSAPHWTVLSGVALSPIETAFICRYVPPGAMSIAQWSIRLYRETVQGTDLDRVSHILVELGWSQSPPVRDHLEGLIESIPVTRWVELAQLAHYADQAEMWRRAAELNVVSPYAPFASAAATDVRRLEQNAVYLLGSHDFVTASVDAADARFACVRSLENGLGSMWDLAPNGPVTDAASVAPLFITGVRELLALAAPRMSNPPAENRAWLLGGVERCLGEVALAQGNSEVLIRSWAAE